MQRTVEYYYKTNRVVLKMLGLWPYYHQSFFVRVQNILFIIILVTFVIAQLLVFITAQYNMYLFLRILSFVFPTILVTIKYCLFVIQANVVKQLMEQIYDDWNMLKNKLEIDIIERYASNARKLTIFLMAICYFSMIVCTIFQLLPMILDVVLPLNESRPCRLIVFTEYFVNQEKYFYPLLMHAMISGGIGAIALSSTLATFMIYVQHVCALFKIASYRIENAIQMSSLAIPSPRRERLLFQRIALAIVIHQRAIRFVEFLTSDFLMSFVLLILVGVSSLSLNFFQFLQLITVTHNTSEIFVCALFIIAHMIYMFLANYGGQKITDHGIQLFTAAYNGLWYAAPLRTQKLLLFVMQKGIKNVTLTCGYVFVMSLEGFATLASTAVSYFTVIYSTR